MRPYTCPGQLGEGEVATWAPSSSTLISGPTEGILIDALLTFENADQIAAWAKSFGKKITGVYITHGHSDHWLGLARLLDYFPCGDVVYNNVHMMMYEADEAKREAWLASIDAVAALNPKIVAGHKSVGAADLPENLAASQQYLRDFTTAAKKGGTVEDLVHGMLEWHGDRDQPHTLWISARAEIARRA